ncbi:MAG: restriction endonuclease [Desulfamplus sp.]
MSALTMDQIDKLQPDLFEAYIAALYEKQSFKTYLTPHSNDKGVDVVAMGKIENYLIQTKQSKSIVGNDAVQEIYTAKNYYENKFKEQFKLIVIANNDFSSSAQTLADINQVKLMGRSLLATMNSQNDVAIQDVNRHEAQRMKTV